MKLNAASNFAVSHQDSENPPFEDQVAFQEMIHELESMLAEITGFAAASLQPNSGAAGVWLLVIASYLKSMGRRSQDS